MGKSRLKFAPEKKITLLTIANKIDWGKIIMAIISLGVIWIGYRQSVNATHHEQDEKKQETVMVKDSSYKVYRRKADSTLIAEQRLTTIKIDLLLHYDSLKLKLKTK